MNDETRESVRQSSVRTRMSAVCFFARRFIVIAFYVTCAVIVAAAILVIGVLSWLSFAGLPDR